MAKQTQIELFLELAKPDKNGISRWVLKTEFVGKYSSVRKQIGMAVPCKGAKVIFEAILKTFARIQYPSIESNLPERIMRHAD